MRGAIKETSMNKFKVWDPEREDEPVDFNAQGVLPSHVAADYAEQRYPDVDECEDIMVHTRDENGVRRLFTVECEIVKSFSAFEEKDTP